MTEAEFGTHLLELRKKAGLSRSELGERTGVSGETVASWEESGSLPPLTAAPALADALNATLAELLTPRQAAGKLARIVITGGPCSGKTTAMSWIQNTFTQMGYTVLFVDETATELITGGAAPWAAVSNRDFQRCLLQLQLDKEKAFSDISGALRGGEKALIVCDRGALDNRAYMTEEEFRYVLRCLNTTEIALRDQYDDVFHLVTAAKGAEKFYTLDNNAARRETPEEAAALDDRLLAAWTGHPHLQVIDNSTDFAGKMRRLMEGIAAFLGEPAPPEVRRKYLIGFPDVEQLAKQPNCKRIDIVQTYLKPENRADEIRLRQRGQDGNYIYYKTVKRTADDGRRVTIEERLSQEEYLSLMPQADPDCRLVRKTRYCLSENGLSYEIDVYPEWTDRAILEVKSRAEEAGRVFPAGIEVLRDVTEDPEYSNRALARKDFPSHGAGKRDEG